MSRSSGPRRMTAGEVLRRTTSRGEMELVKNWMEDQKHIAVWQCKDPASPSHGRCQVGTYSDEPASSVWAGRAFGLIGVWDGVQ